MRYAMLVLAWVLFACAVISALVPFLFVTSTPFSGSVYSVLCWLTFGAPNYIGGVAMRDFLCPIAQEGCHSTITLGQTQSTFQALFTFGIATGVLIQIRNSAERALRKMEHQILKLYKTTDVQKYPAEYTEQVRAICNEWSPRYHRAVRWTYRAALACFYGTAVIAGALLVLTTVSSDKVILYFNHPTSVAFAIAPFASVLLVFFDRMLCEKFIRVALAPTVDVRLSTFQNRRTTVGNRIEDEAEEIRRAREERPDQK